MKKNFLYYVAAIVSLVLIIAGCSNDYNSDGDGSYSGGGDLPFPEYAAETINYEASKDKNMHKVFLLSDIHVMAKELLQDKNNKKYIEYLKTDTKMLEQSPAVLEKLIDLAIEQKSGLVLIAGDLTKDGEYVSHDYVSRQLDRLRQNGIRTLVIPGNHDINNPEGVVYKTGNETEAARKTTPEEFAAFYKNFGYNKDTKDYLNYSRDPSSLSYCCEPFEGLYLVCLDSNSYDQVKPEDTRNQTVGRLRDETISWMMPLVDQAKKDGKQVFVMLHHNLIEHFDGQNGMESMFQIKNSKARLTEFFNHDIELVLTGHVHSRDIATTYEGVKGSSKKLTEITCSSPISYPCAYNVLTLNNALTQVSVKSEEITSITGMEDYQAKARENHKVNEELIKWALDEKWSEIEKAIPLLTVMGINYDFSKGSAGMAKDAAECIGDTGTRFERLFFYGCENKNTDEDIKKDSLKSDVDTAIDNIALKLIVDKEGDSDEEKTKHAGMRTSLKMLLKTYLKVDTIVESVVNDKTAYGTANEDCTDDIETTITLNKVVKS